MSARLVQKVACRGGRQPRLMGKTCKDARYPKRNRYDPRHNPYWIPKFIKEKGAIKELEKDLQKEINSINQKCNISIKKVKEPYRQPNIPAEYIAFQLKNRVPYYELTKKVIELTKNNKYKGVNVTIPGRLGGNEIAHVESI